MHVLYPQSLGTDSYEIVYTPKNNGTFSRKTESRTISRATRREVRRWQRYKIHPGRVWGIDDPCPVGEIGGEASGVKKRRGRLTSAVLNSPK